MILIAVTARCTHVSRFAKIYATHSFTALPAPSRSQTRVALVGVHHLAHCTHRVIDIVLPTRIAQRHAFITSITISFWHRQGFSTLARREHITYADGNIPTPTGLGQALDNCTSSCQPLFTTLCHLALLFTPTLFFFTFIFEIFTKINIVIELAIKCLEG